MKPFVALLTIVFGSATAAHSQTFLEHLQKETQGQAKVTVVQSKEIDELVNGTSPKATVQPSRKTEERPKSEPAKGSGDNALKEANTLKETAKTGGEATKKEEAPKTDTHTKKPETKPETTETAATVIDTRKKVMRSSHKVDGYRVQVYAGGNSRDDKIKAQQAGNRVKSAMPNIPVYVHFISPRWICRIGNFKSQQEASNVLRQVRSMGFKQATIVSQKITVQY